MDGVMVGIYDSKGRLIARTACGSRKAARREFAVTNNAKWHDLWKLGFKVREIKQGIAAKRPEEQWTKTP
jgi:hypothetical protein